MSRKILICCVAVAALLLTCRPVALAQPADSLLPQKFLSAAYGYSFQLPAPARYNELGSTKNEAGKYETSNFILPGGCGSINIWYRTERRMVPKDFKLMSDSIHYFEGDSTGRNGIIHRRVYILTNASVQVDVLLTQKGEAQYSSLLVPMFNSFAVPADVDRKLPLWRYGRNASEYEKGRYENGAVPDR